jgi:hypothetical protein
MPDSVESPRTRAKDLWTTVWITRTGSRHALRGPARASNPDRACNFDEVAAKGAPQGVNFAEVAAASGERGRAVRSGSGSPG